MLETKKYNCYNRKAFVLEAFLFFNARIAQKRVLVFKF